MRNKAVAAAVFAAAFGVAFQATADDPALPAGVAPLGPQVEGGDKLARRLAQVGVVDRDEGQALAVGLLALGSFACTLAALVGHAALSPGFSIAQQRAWLAEVPADTPIFAVDGDLKGLAKRVGRRVEIIGTLGAAKGTEFQRVNVNGVRSLGTCQ